MAYEGEARTKIIGDFDSGNYFEIGTDGQITRYGDFTIWNDVRTAPLSAAHTGARSPVLGTVANDGSVGTDYAVDFTSGKGVVPYYADMNTLTMSINVWLSPDTADSIEIIDRDASGIFEFYINNGSVIFKIGFSRVETDSGLIIAGQTQMVTVTAANEGANTRVKIYVNNQIQKEQVINDTFVTTNNTDGYIVAEYTGGGWNYDGIMDNMFIYNVALTDSQISDMYNGGAGINTHPSGITETTDVIAMFKFDEGTGTLVDNACTLGAGYDMTLSGTYAWVTGLLGITSGSLGVMALSFPPDVITEIFGSVQIPHGYKEGSLIYPHLHWAGEDASAGDVVWKMEYLWVNIGDALGTDTTIVTRTVANDTVLLGKHRMNNLPTAGIDGTGKLISSILQYRIYRDGTDAADTYTKKAYLSEFDIHCEMDTGGSNTAMTK